MTDQFRFCSGNAIEEGRGGWFIGQFVSAQEGLKHQDGLELKWGRHSKGERRRAFAEYKIATTISVLISGVFYTKAIIGEETCEVTLRRPGDYIIFGPKVPHSWEAVEDCIVLSVRFPSVAADQVELPADADRSAPMAGSRPPSNHWSDAGRCIRSSSGWRAG